MNSPTVIPPPVLVPPPEPTLLERALALAEQRLQRTVGANGESYQSHAQGTVRILQELYADELAQVAGALFSGSSLLTTDEIETRFGRPVRDLVEAIRQVMRLRELHERASSLADGSQVEVLRRMMLAMSSDIRVVLVRLASRLQTLRHHVTLRRPPEPTLSRETLQVLAPLANRLGLWQLKWELEDLSFRFLEPDAYRAIAGQLEEKRREREDFVRRAQSRLHARLGAAGIDAQVSGRPKHIYSIYSKMRSKGLSVADILDLRALRVIVGDVPRCYEALSVIHQMWTALPEHFDDYIQRPKPNGYQSLHTVVMPEDGRPLEVQIRTRAMHHHAEYGVASHWAYKESGTGATALRDQADRQRVGWIRQLLAWQREIGEALGGGTGGARAAGSDRIFVLTPQGRIVELPAGATPVDFAYHIHTDLGHRCRGARIDGHMLPLNTPLQNGQTVEIVSARKGIGQDGPSRDWLNAELGFLKSARSRAKVRQWFNARALEADLAGGRARVERIMQREGRTALAFEELAQRVGFDGPDALFLAAAREEIGLRALEEGVRGPTGAAAAPTTEPRLPVARRVSSQPRSSVLVVGVDLLLTQLARCCRPAPPDVISGFVTRGHGVSVHRASCSAFGRMRAAAPERVLEASWGPPDPRRPARYPVDVLVLANDRQGLLRDVSDVFARDKLNVIAVNSLSRGEQAKMQFTVEVPDADTLQRALVGVGEVRGVFTASRKPA